MSTRKEKCIQKCIPEKKSVSEKCILVGSQILLPTTHFYKITGSQLGHLLKKESISEKCIPEKTSVSEKKRTRNKIYSQILYWKRK
jgi:hypothetical protein